MVNPSLAKVEDSPLVNTRDRDFFTSLSLWVDRVKRAQLVWKMWVFDIAIR